jgi:hypothetical protein
MANEISVKITFSFSKGGVKFPEQSFTDDITVAGTDAKHGTQTIGFAAEEAIALGDVAAGGCWFIVNRDPTNFVEIRPNTGVADLITLNPGEFTWLRTSSDAVPYAQADTGNCLIEFWIIDA